MLGHVYLCVCVEQVQQFAIFPIVMYPITYCTIEVFVEKSKSQYFIFGSNSKQDTLQDETAELSKQPNTKITKTKEIKTNNTAMIRFKTDK